MGIQYHYDCKEAGVEGNSERNTILLKDDNNDVHGHTNDSFSNADEDGKHLEIVVSQSDLDMFKESQKNMREDKYTCAALSIG